MILLLNCYVLDLYNILSNLYSHCNYGQHDHFALDKTCRVKPHSFGLWNSFGTPKYQNWKKTFYLQFLCYYNSN